jgi:hypothetical protein
MKAHGHHRLADANLTAKPAYPPGADSPPTRSAPRGLWRALTGRASTLPLLISFAIAAAYLVVFAVKLSHNIAEVGWVSDYASAFTLPETLVRTGTGGNTVISSSGQWVPLWFGLLTAKLPLHRQLWEIAPTLLYIATALIVGWCVLQVAGRRAAVLATLIGLAVSPFALVIFVAAFAHNTVYPCTALIGAYLIWLTHGQGRSRLVAFAVPPLLGVAVGTCLASDLLLAVTAAIPLTVTAIFAGVRRDRRSRLIALSALATVAVAVPIAKLTTAVMHSQGFLTLPTPVKDAALSELPVRAKFVFKGLQALFNGYLGTVRAPGTLYVELGIAADIAMSAGLLALLVLGIGAGVRLISSGLRRTGSQTPAELGRSLHVLYWAGSAVAACGAFWIAGETGATTDLHEAYYASAIFSVAAVAPLLLASRSAWLRMFVPAGAAVYFAGSLVGLAGNYTNIAGVFPSDAPAIAKIAEANHVDTGYASYEQASNLTWSTDGLLTVRPVWECQNPSGAEICPFYVADVPSWYAPRQRHTFLLVDTEDIWIKTVPSGLGRPLAAYRLGALSMYIYPYDIAARLGPQAD